MTQHHEQGNDGTYLGRPFPNVRYTPPETMATADIDWTDGRDTVGYRIEMDFGNGYEPLVKSGWSFLASEDDLLSVSQYEPTEPTWRERITTRISSRVWDWRYRLARAIYPFDEGL